MLDIRFVRENIDLVNKAMESRNFTWDSKRFLQLDEDRRSAIAQEEALLSQRNTISKSIGALMGEGKKEEAEAAKAEVAKLKEKIAYYADLHEQAESALNELILAIPNIPSETTPIGKDEDDNPEVRRWGTPPAGMIHQNFEFRGFIIVYSPCVCLHPRAPLRQRSIFLRLTRIGYASEKPPPQGIFVHRPHILPSY